MYLKMSPGNQCVAILNKQKCHFFFFYKSREQEGNTGPAWELIPLGGGWIWGAVIEE
jgi:hypothetical protein